MKVSEDPGAAVSTLVPDFKDGSNTGYDYSYDQNGNLQTDANKGITNNIQYNYLNKPTHIVVNGKGYVDYIYDANGSLLRKVVYDQVANTTQLFDYELPFVFKDNVLQYIQHEEGRCRPKPTAINGVADYEYDFFVKDHLQNVRTVVNSQTAYLGPVLEYDATLEVAASQAESFLWSHLDDVRNNNPQSNSTGDTKAAELIGTIDSQRVGTTLMLRVMPGDRFNLSAESYFDAVGNNSVNTPDQLVSSLLTALAGGSLYNNVPVSETPQNVMAINNTVGRGDFVQAYTSLRNQISVDSTAPSSFLNYIVFDEAGNMISDNSGVLQCASSGSQWNTVGVSTPIEIGQPGYILFFTSSEAANATYWDDIAITYQRGNVLEENHYYPFGLTLNSPSPYPSEHNKYLLTTKELQEEHGLNWFDFGARMQDMQIGRWNGIDEKSEKYVSYSPYNYLLNNPTCNIDIDGRDVKISGSSVASVLDHLNSSPGLLTTTVDPETGSLILGVGKYYIDETSGNLACTGRPITDDAIKLKEAIDDNTILVNLVANDNNRTPDGRLGIGGVFGGNVVSTNANNVNTVVATQYVFPAMLAKLEDIYKKVRGTGIRHEITEAYSGALAGQSSGVSAAYGDGPDYDRAHSARTTTKPITQRNNITRAYIGTRWVDPTVETPDRIEVYAPSPEDARKLILLLDTGSQ